MVTGRVVYALRILINIPNEIDSDADISDDNVLLENSICEKRVNKRHYEGSDENNNNGLFIKVSQGKLDIA